MYDFILKQVKRFNNYMAINQPEMAYQELGMVLHPLMDMWSPAHTGFQEWNWATALTPELQIPHILREVITLEGVPKAIESITLFYDHIIKH